MYRKTLCFVNLSEEVISMSEKDMNRVSIGDRTKEVVVRLWEDYFGRKRKTIRRSLLYVPPAGKCDRKTDADSE